MLHPQTPPTPHPTKTTHPLQKQPNARDRDTQSHRTFYSLKKSACTTDVCKLIFYHTHTCYLLTHHSGVCRPDQTMPLEPSISPGDDPEDIHIHTDTRSNNPSCSWCLAKETCLNFNHCWDFPIPAERSIRGSSLGNKPREEYFPVERLQCKSNRADKQDQR